MLLEPNRHARAYPVREKKALLDAKYMADKTRRMILLARSKPPGSAQHDEYVTAAHAFADITFSHLLRGGL